MKIRILHSNHTATVRHKKPNRQPVYCYVRKAVKKATK